MSVVYLHIGLPKTGTSTVQAAIQELRPLLASKGYWTPEGIVTHHRFAIGAVDENDPRRKLAHFQRVLAKGDAAVFGEFEQAFREGKNILISSEYLASCDAKAVARLLARLGVPPAEVRVIVVLRRQDRFIASIFNQEVKRTGRTRPLAWSRDHAAGWDWHRRLAPWAEEFGEQAIRVLVYERLMKQAPGIRFVNAVLGACDLVLEVAALEGISARIEKYRNPSLPAELLEFKRVANMVTQIGELDWLVDRALTTGVGNTRFHMDRALAAEIVEFYRPSNAEVARRFLKEAGELFDDELDDPGTAARPRFDLRTMSQLIALLAAEIGALRIGLRTPGANRKMTHGHGASP